MGVDGIGSLSLQLLTKQLRWAGHCAGNRGMRMRDVVSSSGSLLSPGETDDSVWVFGVLRGTSGAPGGDPHQTVGAKAEGGGGLGATGWWTPSRGSLGDDDGEGLRSRTSMWRENRQGRRSGE